MNEATCKFCRAEYYDIHLQEMKSWVCGTLEVQGEFGRSDQCFGRQLVAQAALLRRWLKNEINHVFQNSTLQENTKALLKDLEDYKGVE